MIRRILLSALLLTVTLPAQAQQAADVAVAAPVQPQHEWPFAESDLPPDPAYRFGRLDNGMRYVIRPNATPKGTAMVQFWVDAGSIAETEDELGYAHFIEHMAFNGSEHFKPGELVSFLESIGARFGPHVNASTSFDETIYMLGKHPNVFADVSGLLSRPWQAYNALVSCYQADVIDKLLFGSDFPYTNAVPPA